MTRAALAKIAAAALVVFVAASSYFYWFWHRPLRPGGESYVVAPGTTLRGFAQELRARGVLSDTRSFVWLAYVLGHNRDLKAGEYRFRRGITAGALLKQVTSGQVVEHPLLLVDGETFAQLMASLNAAPKLTHTLRGASPQDIMARLGQPGESPEGQFFPDTYYYSAGDTDAGILRRAYRAMQRRLRQEWDRRAPGLPFRDPYEALILASIVEKESARADEQALVAGVYINRLRLGMRLQADPTVIYGLGAAFDGVLHDRDLRRDTPYNTYTRTGLPPTPIAMPGASSLHAALHPAATRALYFVSRGDGTHEFSRTLDQQDRAVIKYELHGAAGPPVSAPRPGHQPRQRPGT